MLVFFGCKPTNPTQTPVDGQAITKNSTQTIVETPSTNTQNPPGSDRQELDSLSPDVQPLLLKAQTTPITLPRLTPVTLGDAVIEPFFDSSLRAWSWWKIIQNRDAVKVTEQWCKVSLAWTAKAAGFGPMLRRVYPATGVELGPYSQLVLSAGFPKGTLITVLAETDKGLETQKFVCEAGYTSQHVMPLPIDSTHLLRVEISFGAAVSGQVEGHLLWLGVRDPQQFVAEQAKWQMFSAQPLDVFLREVPEPAEALPLFNIQCPADTFKKIRENAVISGNTSPLQLRSEVTLLPHLGGVNQNLFGRKEIRRDVMSKTFSTPEGKFLGLKDAAQKAAVANDRQALREVAKAAIQIALIPHWDVDFITAFPDSSWSQRCFSQASTCYDVAIAFDLAGSWLTPPGRKLLLRRLTEEGLGNINFDVWSNPYIFFCNQLPVFSVGRLAVYSLLEKQEGWGHVRPYTNLAFDELNESLAKNFVADGGFPEGPGYLSYTLLNSLPALSIYGNAREKPLYDLLPPLLSKTDDYFEAMRSTVYPPGTILVCDAQGGPFAGFSAATLNVMAKIRPGGAAARMLASQSKEYRNSMALWALPAADLTAVDPNEYVAFVQLPVSGFASSARKVGGLWSKLFVIGGPAKAGHNHEDRGSFALEFAGETFAADPGGKDYSDAMAQTMKHAQNHNMLVPWSSAPERPAPQNPAAVAVIPVAQGNITTFNASINAGVLWPDYYKSWQRSFTSASPAELTIIDDYEIIAGDGVDFLWHTPLPVTQENGLVIIQGAGGKVFITPPAGCRVGIIPPRLLGTKTLSSICFRIIIKSGRLETMVRLEPNVTTPLKPQDSTK